MKNDLQVSVVDDDHMMRNMTVLRIASAAKNSVTQIYSDRIQISIRSIDELHRKLANKLDLHRIHCPGLTLSIQFANDKTVIFNTLNKLHEFDLQIDSLTQIITLKWSFVFDPANDGNDHLHSVFIRISERPSPSIIFQRILSGHNDDIESLDGDALAPIVCKIDFIDNRFSNELLAVVTEWVKSLPKAVPTFQFAKNLQKHENKITNFIYSTLPALAIVSYISIWMVYVPEYISSSVRNSASWVLGGGVVFIFARTLAASINGIFTRIIQCVCNVPIFKITAGDGNRISSYLAKSQSSFISLAAGAFFYGIFKAIGVYLMTKLIGLYW